MRTGAGPHGSPFTNFGNTAGGGLSLAGTTYWTMTDREGSVTDVLDSAGKLRIHRKFDSFGNAVSETHYSSTGSVVTSGPNYIDEAFAYTGRWFDKDTGLQNNLNRWYDAGTGRWLNEDPIGFNAGDANLYRYVGNSPTNAVDPSGLQPPPNEGWGDGHGGRHGGGGGPAYTPPGGWPEGPECKKCSRTWSQWFLDVTSGIPDEGVICWRPPGDPSATTIWWASGYVDGKIVDEFVWINNPGAYSYKWFTAKEWKRGYKIQ